MSASVTDVARFVVRVGLGATLIAHGGQKLFGWFGGGGVQGTGQFFESVGITPGEKAALASGLAEAGGGAALVLGLGTPAAGAAVAANMGVALTQHTPNGFFNADGGFEFPAFLGLTAATFAFSGAGALSLDHLLGDVFAKPWMRVIAVISIPVAVAAVVYQQRQNQANPPAVADAPESAEPDPDPSAAI